MRALAIIGLLVALLVGAFFIGERALHEIPSGDGAGVEFQVAEGEGLATIASRLEEEGLVVSARRLRLLARLNGTDRQIHSGTYILRRGVAPDSILADFVHGRVRMKRLLVPEGWRLPQIAAEVENVLGIPAAEFEIVAADSALRAQLACRTPNLEGYLFPETYFFPDGIGAAAVVREMTDRFERTYEALSGPNPLDLDRHEVVTLASIVEAETGVASERARVAAVYTNRLVDGWMLQADPTVRYGLGRFTERLYYKHLDVESPYNTYRNHGLPPGPIGAPGRAALQAVLDPLDPCDDFFFVASGDGGHVFSRTKAEHDRAVAAFRRR